MPISVQFACVLLTAGLVFSFPTIRGLWNGDAGVQRRLLERLPGSPERIHRKIRALPATAAGGWPIPVILPVYYVLGGGEPTEIACVVFCCWMAVTALVSGAVYFLAMPAWAIPPHLRHQPRTLPL
jgi:hypothetical protein